MARFDVDEYHRQNRSDRRDWVDVSCPSCHWGVRVPPEQQGAAVANHHCPVLPGAILNVNDSSHQNSGEEKKPFFCDKKLHNNCSCTDVCLERPHSPSNATEPHPPIISSTELDELADELIAPPIIKYDSGVHRTSTDGKIDYSLVDLPMLKRWAEHMTKGAETHGRENWRKAHTEEDLQRFRSSAFRHFIQWFEGENGEDHAAAVLFNIAGAEMTAKRLREERLPDPDVTGFA